MSNNVTVMFCVSAVDEFDRKFNYNHAVASVDMDICFGPSARFYSYLFEITVRKILERMGSEADAEWECEMREWDFGDESLVSGHHRC